MPSRLVIINPITEFPFAPKTARGGETTPILNNEIALCGTTAGAVTVDLPPPGVLLPGTTCCVVDEDGNASTNNITVDGNGSTIDGGASVLITSDGLAAGFVYDGQEFRQVAVRRSLGGTTPERLELAIDTPSATPSANFGSQNIETTGALLLGTPPRAATGEIRLPNDTAQIMFRNALDTADLCSLRSTSSNELQLGGGTYTEAPLNLYLIANQTMYFTLVTSAALVINQTNGFQSGLPIVGANVPYGVHGGVIMTPAADTDYTVPAAEYMFDWLELATGSWTGDHDVILPHPATKSAGYYKTFVNTTLFTATVSTGTGTTVAMLLTTACRLWIDDTGVRKAGFQFTP